VPSRLVSPSVLALALLVSCSSGTPTSGPPSAPLSESADSISTSKAGTKLAAFQAKTGAVIIQGFSKIGTVPALYGAHVAVQAKEYTNASDGTREYGVTIEVKEGGTLERESTSYIDYDELESLLSGIDYIVKIDKSVTQLANFQADYRTKGDFGISTFSSAGQILAAVKSGTIGGASAFYKLTDLALIRNHIASARTVLDSLKAAIRK
jgi:hypothetical protein